VALTAPDVAAVVLALILDAEEACALVLPETEDSVAEVEDDETEEDFVVVLLVTEEVFVLITLDAAETELVGSVS